MLIDRSKTLPIEINTLLNIVFKTKIIIFLVYYFKIIKNLLNYH